jgi:formamidopyrimidine-DNA glycosylase
MIITGVISDPRWPAGDRRLNTRVNHTMPELPEVERGRRLAESAVAGKRIERVATVDDRIVFSKVNPRRFAATLRGRCVEAVCRRGKHLWMELDARPWPAFHFGMTGAFEVYREIRERPRFWKVELLMEDGMRLAMRNARRLGRIRLLNDPAHEPPISELGFDPLLDLPRTDVLVTMLSKRAGPIKAVLLDQGFAAGVGNWIADEVLYQSGIAPHRPACGLSRDEVQRLRSQLGRVVRRAVEVNAEKARFPRTWLFHHRWGRNADAVTARSERIVHETIGGRTTAWVPVRQR